MIEFNNCNFYKGARKENSEVVIIRCKECQHHVNERYCIYHQTGMRNNDYCSRAERKLGGLDD